MSFFSTIKLVFESGVFAHFLILTAVPADTTLIAYPVIEGRWLQPGDSNALVINHKMLYDHDAGIRPGDSVVSINVMERSREIGIMRAIGASTGAILQVVMAEGLVIGLLSWVVALALARPLSVTVGNFAGWLFVRSDLVHVFSSGAMWGWLALIVAISLVASFFPAWTAARLTVREVVAYE